MSLRKSICLLGIATTAGLWAGVCAGQNSDPIPARLLSGVVKNDAPLGSNPYYSVYVTAGKSELGFALPPGFRMNAYAQRILLVNADNSCFLTVRLINPGFNGSRGLDPELCRKLIFSQYPGASMSGEFSCRMGSQMGTAYNLRWTNTGGTAQSICVGYLPSAAGVVEVGLVTATDKFDDGLTYFRMVLASLRFGEPGKAVEPATPPGNS